MGDFCYWEAKSLEDCLIVYFNILMTALLAYFAAKYYAATPLRLRRRVMPIFVGVALWVLTNLAKDLYSVTVYHLFVTAGEFSRAHSKVFAILDTAPAVLVQTLFLVIPYMMWKNVVRILWRMEVERSVGEQEFLNFFTFYLTIRFVILVLPWAALIALPLSAAANANFVKLAMQLIDSLICNVLLVGSVSSFLRRFAQVRLQSAEEGRRLKWEYGMMVACSSFRFLIDLGFLVILPLFSTADCISPLSQHLYFSLGYTLCGAILMHILPIALVLRIYKPETPSELTDSANDVLSSDASSNG